MKLQCARCAEHDRLLLLLFCVGRPAPTCPALKKRKKKSTRSRVARLRLIISDPGNKATVTSKGKEPWLCLPEYDIWIPRRN